MKWKRDHDTGIAIAMQQGIEKGKIEDKRNVLIRLLSKKYGLSSDEEKFINSINNYEKLDNAIDEILLAMT